ncbi:MAG: pilus assembly protein [Dechloromonas sp.]|nr:MAG: pilus assembly protein [Dechloromonas sp.]
MDDWRQRRTEHRLRNLYQSHSRHRGQCCPAAPLPHRGRDRKRQQPDAKRGYGNQGNQYVYRVTARGFGTSVDSSGNPIARVTVQSMYKP